MRKLSSDQVLIGVAIILFVTFAPFLVDTFNSTNRRMFLDLALKGTPYSMAEGLTWPFRGEVVHLEFPYPPITILLEIPGWAVFHLTQSEHLYQLFFKLPLFISAVVTQLILNRISRENNLTGIRLTLARSYLLNPAVLLLTTVSGGYEVVAAMLILLGYYLYLNHRTNWSALSLGTAGALRLYPFALVPIFAVLLWKRDRPNLRNLGSFLVLSLAPLILSCLPFLVLDSSGLISFLKGQQTQFGPFATVNFLVIFVYPMALLMGLQSELQTLNYLFVGLALVGLTCLYYKWMVKYSNRLSVLEGTVLAALVFALFYPKWHGLYWSTFLPLTLIQRQRVTPWIWLPGTVWMLLVNGAFGASGLYYWLAPATGIWINSVPAFAGAFLTIMLSGIQALLLLRGIQETIGPTRTVHAAISKS